MREEAGMGETGNRSQNTREMRLFAADRFVTVRDSLRRLTLEAPDISLSSDRIHPLKPVNLDVS
jgi:hypothetical protein